MQKKKKKKVEKGDPCGREKGKVIFDGRNQRTEEAKS